MDSAQEILSLAQETTEEAPVETEATEAPEQEVADKGDIELKESEPEPSPDFSKQFAALARREKQLRAREDSVKDVEQRRTASEELQKLAKDDPLALMRKFGIEYSDLTHRVLNDGNASQEEAGRHAKDVLTNRLNALEEAEKKRVESAEASKLNTVYQGLVDEIRQMVENNPKYELIGTRGAFSTVAEVMQEHYNQHQEVLGLDKACELVETYFESEIESYLKSSKTRDKYQALLAEQATKQAEAEQDKKEAPASTRPRTLTNDLATQKPVESTSQMLPREESLERIAQMLMS